MINMEDRFGGENHFLDIDYTFEKPIFFDENEYYSIESAIDDIREKNIEKWDDMKDDVIKKETTNVTRSPKVTW